MSDDKWSRFRPGGCGCLPGCGGFMLVIGKQDGAPAIDLYLVLR
jgi:hypothetical protein